uniref:FHA domain-containing protein n=1 Tax=Streptomyces sp. NBC_01401 TaxID=2903854 RepID=A0AAU3H792_9ACTN
MKPTAAVGRLVRQWRGHVVEVSPKGLSIDGRTVDPASLTERDAVKPADDPRIHPSLQFLDGGFLVYRGHVQAEVHPGEVTVHGPKGPEWPPEHAREPAREPQPERHTRLVRDEPGAGPAPPEVDDELDIDF